MALAAADLFTKKSAIASEPVPRSKRAVAINILPASVAAEDERLTGFQREAEVLVEQSEHRGPYRRRGALTAAAWPAEKNVVG
jgi:hypothetical protein